MLYLVALKSDNEAAKAEAAAYLPSISETCWHEFDDVWFIQSNEEAVKIRDHLKRFLGPNDRVTVAFLAGFAAWHGFDAGSENWLLKHM